MSKKKTTPAAKAPVAEDTYEEVSLDDISTIDDGTMKLESQISGDELNGELDDCDDDLLRGD